MSINSLPKRTPLATPVRPTPESILQDKDKNWKETETAIEDLKSIELIPLVMDIVSAASTGTLRAQDVENAAGPIKVRLAKAREILRNIHGLAETPEERSIRVEKLKRNIEVKEKSLQRFKALVSQRVQLAQPSGETTLTESLQHIESSANAINSGSVPLSSQQQQPALPTETNLHSYQTVDVPFTTTIPEQLLQQQQDGGNSHADDANDDDVDVDMIDETEFNGGAVDISGIDNIPNLAEDPDQEINMG